MDSECQDAELLGGDRMWRSGDCDSVLLRIGIVDRVSKFRLHGWIAVPPFQKFTPFSRLEMFGTTDMTCKLVKRLKLFGRVECRVHLFHQEDGRKSEPQTYHEGHQEDGRRFGL